MFFVHERSRAAAFIASLKYFAGAEPASFALEMPISLDFWISSGINSLPVQRDLFTCLLLYRSRVACINSLLLALARDSKQISFGGADRYRLPPDYGSADSSSTKYAQASYLRTLLQTKVAAHRFDRHFRKAPCSIPIVHLRPCPSRLVEKINDANRIKLPCLQILISRRVASGAPSLVNASESGPVPHDGLWLEWIMANYFG